MQATIPLLMFVLFLGLKLGEVIDWSWWWVTAPLWVTAICALVVWAIIAVIFVRFLDIHDSSFPRL